MKTKILLLLLSVVALFKTAFTQDCPPNIDFEAGTFDNWECSVGTTSVSGTQNNISLTPSGPLPGRHEIISGLAAAKDRYGNFPQLCPYGGKYSVKLGNDGSGAQAEGLSYTFQVPSSVDTFSFTYFYAVVFEDPKHIAREQPRFFVTAYDAVTGALINCASYNYVATGSIPGFKVSSLRSDVLYKEWSPVSIQFAGLANRSVRLEFKTADCTPGGHFGYAYVDVGSGCSNILATAPYCVETNSIILNAPYGFQSYTWYNQNYSAVIGNQQTLVLSPPPVTSGVFYVDIVPYPGYGCRDTAQAIVTPLPVPDTPAAPSDQYYCQFSRAQPLTATPQPGSDLIWYTTATGGTGSINAPIPVTTAAGVFTYYVSQKVLFGCESLRKKITVTVNPTPVVSFIINDDKQCEKGNVFRFASTSTNLSNSTYTWTFGDGQTVSSSDSITTYTYAKYGTFTIKLKVQNPPQCFSEKQGGVIVIPNPVAAFTHPPLLCEKETPVLLKDASSVPNNLDKINSWWWNINGSLSGLQNPVSFMANTPGTMPVQLVVTSAQGCTSDTSHKTLVVRYRPDAAFRYSKLLCDNETIQFTNLSSMRQGAAPESLSKWYWQFDNGNSSILKDPSQHFSAGQYGVTLIAESDYGCKSSAADSALTIYPKPYIQLRINDSCVFRSINYTATDSLNAVTKWNWNFGAGFKEGASLITRSYNTEGYRPLTLIGQTIYGCKDTIIRPFTLYDNKAFAGRDTIAAMDEPMQLSAHGRPDMTYLWSPSAGLNNATLENPVAIWDKDQLYKLDALTKEGCDSHTKILIKRFKGPELYVPNAFTPNKDGKNDVLRVFPVGIKAFQYFAIYNRWGEPVYKTTDYTNGWDGTYKGQEMSTGVFIFVVQAIDYKGKIMLRKGTVTLIR